MGWHSVSTHLGVTMTGRTSVRYRSISKLAEPAPMTTAARSSTVSIGPSASTSPTSWRLRKMGAELAAVIAQPTEVDDASHACMLR